MEEQGSPIILAHGSTEDNIFWQGYGYVDQLKDQYTFMVFDARGHGKSIDILHRLKPWEYVKV